MRTITPETLNVYLFGELSPEAQRNAVEAQQKSNWDDYDMHQFSYEDVVSAGVALMRR